MNSDRKREREEDVVIIEDDDNDNVEQARMFPCTQVGDLQRKVARIQTYVKKHSAALDPKVLLEELESIEKEYVPDLELMVDRYEANIDTYSAYAPNNFDTCRISICGVVMEGARKHEGAYQCKQHHLICGLCATHLELDPARKLVCEPCDADVKFSDLSVITGGTGDKEDDEEDDEDDDDEEDEEEAVLEEGEVQTKK